MSDIFDDVKDMIDRSKKICEKLNEKVNSSLNSEDVKVDGNHLASGRNYLAV